MAIIAEDSKQCIKSGSFIDYVFLFGESRNYYTDMVARNVEAKQGILIMFCEDKPAGYMLVNPDNGLALIAHAYTSEAWRRKGVFTALLRYALEHIPGPSFMVTVSDDAKEFGIIAAVCKKLGFYDTISCRTMRAEWESMKEWKYGPWDKFMAEKGEAYRQMFQRQGFRIHTFQEAAPELIEQLRHSRENAFGNTMDVSYFFEGHGKRELRNDYSTLVEKEGQLAAYMLVSSPDGKSIICEQNSVAERYRNSGIVVLMQMALIELIEKDPCHRVALAVYDDNSSAWLYVKKMFKNLKMITSSMHKFRLDKKA